MTENQGPRTVHTVTCEDGDEPRTFDVTVPEGMTLAQISLCSCCPYKRMCSKAQGL